MVAMSNAPEPVEIDQLSKKDVRYLARTHAILRKSPNALIVASENKDLLEILTSLAKRRELLEATIAITELLLQQEAQIDKLVDVLTPKQEILSPATFLQARRNAEARHSFLERFGALKSEEVADIAGSSAKNRAATANRWKRQGQIFSVPHRGGDYFPAFQFDESGQPLPTISSLISLFRQSEWNEWETALWFSAPNGWLDGATPVSLLERDPDSVVNAARQELEARVF